MTHPFDEIAVEAGAKAAWEEEAQPRPMRLPMWSDISDKEHETWRGISHATLSAAFQSARERGMARDGTSLKSGWEGGIFLVMEPIPEGAKVETVAVTCFRHKENEHG